MNADRDEPPECDGASGYVLAAAFITMSRASAIWRNSVLSLVNVQRLAGADNSAGTSAPYWPQVRDNRSTARRILKKAVQQGRSERRGEAYASVR